MEFLHPAIWHDHIDFVRWLHAAMWHVALESWQWIHQVAAPCNVIRVSGMTCHWIRPYVHHIGILHLVLFPRITAVDMSFCTSLRNFIQIGPPSAEKNDVMSIFKIADLSHLGLYGSNNGFFKKPMYDFLYVVTRDHSSKLLSFSRKSRFLHFGDRRRTNRWTAPMHSVASGGSKNKHRSSHAVFIVG